MTRGKVFETIDLDLASFLEASTGRCPSVFRESGTGLATVHFSNTPELETLVLAYTTGTAVVSVRRVLAARRRLFHEVRRLKMVVK